MTRLRVAFGALVLAQAAHSVEEYIGRLWESFPPARFITGLISQDRERGFIVLNVSLVAFGLWCLLWPVRREWPSAVYLGWAWVIVEIINGIGHPLWTLREGGRWQSTSRVSCGMRCAIHRQPPDNAFERTGERRGRTVLAIDCVLADAQWRQWPLNWVV